MCITLICAGALGICETLVVPEGSPFAPRQQQTATQDAIAPVSISKGTVLILLIVGIVGVLSVRRKKMPQPCCSDGSSPDPTGSPR